MKDDLYLINRIINLYIDVEHSLKEKYDIYKYKQYELQELEKLLTDKSFLLKVFTSYSFETVRRKNINDIIELYKKSIKLNNDNVQIEIRINKTRIEFSFNA